MIKKFLFFLMSAVIVVNLIFISFWLNLSDEKLTPWVEFQLNSRLDSRYQTDIKRVSTRIWGIKAEEIKLMDISKNSELLSVQSLEISFNIISLFIYRSLPYKAEVYEGEVSGALKAEGWLSLSPEFYLTFNGKGILPNHNPALRKTELIASNPALDIEKGALYLSSPLRADFTLAIKELKLSGNMESVGAPLKLPEISFKSLKAVLSAKDKKIKASLKSSGDISGKLKGTVLANQRNLKNSELNFVLRASFEKRYWERLDFLKNLIKNYLNKSNEIHIKILGTFSRPGIQRI